MSPDIPSVLAPASAWSVWWIIAVGATVILLGIIAVATQLLRLWVQAFMSRAGVTFYNLIGMRLRGSDLTAVVYSRIQLVKSGIHDMGVNDLENHHLAGGRVASVTRAVIAANRADLALSWRQACAIDLAGRDIVGAINTSVNPKVIDVPDPERGRPSIDAVAKDGIQLRAKARVTVRTNLRQLIGGATEETIIARVGEGMVSAIGSSSTYKAVLENPNRISKAVLSKGLDAGTAYEILSVDIADLDVGENIGAKLQVDQAAADTRRFQAEAEQRRTMAIASIAEHRAEIEENRAKVVLAEAEVPTAMAEAFRSGNLGIGRRYHGPGSG